MLSRCIQNCNWLEVHALALPVAGPPCLSDGLVVYAQAPPVAEPPCSESDAQSMDMDVHDEDDLDEWMDEDMSEHEHGEMSIGQLESSDLSPQGEGLGDFTCACGAWHVHDVSSPVENLDSAPPGGGRVQEFPHVHGARGSQGWRSMAARGGYPGPLPTPGGVQGGSTCQGGTLDPSPP